MGKSQGNVQDGEMAGLCWIGGRGYMSYFNPVVKYEPIIEEVDYIAPERLREACRYRMYSYDEAAGKCDIDVSEFGLMANGYKEIPSAYIFKFMKGLGFPKKFFYRIKWERT